MNKTQCNCNFDSSFAYIVNNINDDIKDKIYISDYLSNETLKNDVIENKKLLVCSNKNILIKYESKVSKSYFKHKSNSIMTTWHKNWQDNFEKTEQHIGNRIADAVIDNMVIEFQHSYISVSEVSKRGIDYNSHGYNIIWVIDANDSIKISDKIGDIYLIHFIKDYWKYENFISNEYIFLNIDNRIFRIKPKEVKSNMIDVKEYKNDNDFIVSLYNKNNIWDNNEIIQCMLYHNQRGAGCGKTYESIQLLNNNNDKFKDKELFIYLTKAHSAKEVIYNELIEQQKKGILNNIIIAPEFNNIHGKQYKLSYNNKITNKICTLIIGTIDSFMYAIGNTKNRDSDYFAGIVKSIKNGYTDTTKDGSIKYSSDTIKLNKQCLIIIDEAQDLGPEYIEAVCVIMRNTYIDAYIIGDKLQSIWGEHNIHTFLEINDLPNITIERNTGINHVMRFHNSQFPNLVNSIIDFSKYNLPKIEKICDIKTCKYTHEDDIKPYNILEVQTIYAEETDEDKVEKLIEKIINFMNQEIYKYNYLPKNFMFIFPILKKNFLANRLESRIQDFWINKFNDKSYQNSVLIKNDFWKNKNNNDYHKYVYLHKSDEGKSINLKESDQATRILSIHASKGNGCEVVFLFGLTEYALRIYSKEKNNIVYESLIHVALTRQKKSLYIGIENNNDDIYNRFNSSTCDIKEDYDIKPRLENIKLSYKYNKILEYIPNIPNIFKNIDSTYIKPNNYESLISDSDNKNIVDWGHHIIRNYVFRYYIKYYMSNDLQNNGKQLNAILYKISKMQISYYTHKDYYKHITIKDKRENEILILSFISNEQQKYHKFKKILTNFIERIQKKIIKSLDKNLLPLLCPLEIIILYYIILIRDEGKFSELTIMDVYSILYCYDECYVVNDNHDNMCKCCCKDSFTSTNTNKYTDIQANINKHYEKTLQIKELYNNYKDELQKYDKYNEFKYHMNHYIKLGDNHDNFKISTKCELIAYSKKYVINFIIKPQFNKLNFYEIMCSGVLNKYLLLNPCSKSKNYDRYNDKQVITCILTLDSVKPIFINFNVNKNDIIIKEIIKNYLINESINNHIIINRFYQYCKLNKPKDTNSITHTYNTLREYMAEDRDNIPKYIEDYLYDINKEVEICKKERRNKEYIEDNVLIKINDYDTFMDNISKEADKSINNYLCIKNENIEDILEDF
jgi:hypothetical protein